ncbi:MAG: hypothetical protein WCX48_10730 [Bacteroidales bacterium]
MRDRRTPAEAKALIERFQMSGHSTQEFCAEELINPATFYYWRKRFRMIENQEPSMLIPVCLDKSETDRSKKESKSLELTYPNGVQLSIPLVCEPSLIRELVMFF